MSGIVFTGGTAWRIAMNDPIVDEVRRVREEHARRFGFDLDAICEDLRRIQETCGHRIVSFPPKMLTPAKASGRRKTRGPVKESL